MLWFGPLSFEPQPSDPWPPDRYACAASHGPRTTALGPLLKGRETSLADGFPVTRLVRLEQTAVHQKPKAAFADLDRRNHGHTP